MTDAVPQYVQRALAAVAEVAPDLAARIAAFASARPRRRREGEQLQHELFDPRGRWGAWSAA